MPFEARFSGVKAPGSKDTSRPTFRRPRRPSRPVPSRPSPPHLFAGAKAGQPDRRLRRAAWPRPLRSDGRLGLLLFHHQAALQTAALAGPVLGQLRPRHPRRHRAGQARLLPAREQELRVHGEDEDAAAGDGEAARALQGRPRQDAAGADDAVSGPEDQPDGGLPAHLAADPGVLRALQGAVHHHRHAACAVLRLDQGPVRARPHVDLQPVRAAALRPPRVPARGRVAHRHGHHHVDSDAVEPAAARPRAAAHLQLDAGDVHLPAGVVLGRGW